MIKQDDIHYKLKKLLNRSSNMQEFMEGYNNITPKSAAESRYKAQFLEAAQVQLGDPFNDFTS